MRFTSTAFAVAALGTIAVGTSPAASACATASGGAVVDCDGTGGEIRATGPGSVITGGTVANSPGAGAVNSQGAGDDSLLNGNVDYDGTQDARTANSPYYGPQYRAG